METKQTLPAGTYWIGDLCYVMHEVWDEVRELLFGEAATDDGEGVFTLKDGRKFAIFNTAHGDGSYPYFGQVVQDEQHDKLLGVDAGCIGCILVSDIVVNSDNNTSLGIIAIQPKEFAPSNDGGDMSFGVIEVLTTGDDEDEDSNEFGYEEIFEDEFDQDESDDIEEEES